MNWGIGVLGPVRASRGGLGLQAGKHWMVGTPSGLWICDVETNEERHFKLPRGCETATVAGSFRGLLLTHLSAAAPDVGIGKYIYLNGREINPTCVAGATKECLCIGDPVQNKWRMFPWNWNSKPKCAFASLSKTFHLLLINGTSYIPHGNYGTALFAMDEEEGWAGWTGAAPSPLLEETVGAVDEKIVFHNGAYYASLVDTSYIYTMEGKEPPFPDLMKFRLGRFDLEQCTWNAVPLYHEDHEEGSRLSMIECKDGRLLLFMDHINGRPDYELVEFLGPGKLAPVPWFEQVKSTVATKLNSNLVYWGATLRGDGNLFFWAGGESALVYLREADTWKEFEYGCGICRDETFHHVYDPQAAAGMFDLLHCCTGEENELVELEHLPFASESQICYALPSLKHYDSLFQHKVHSKLAFLAKH